MPRIADGNKNATNASDQTSHLTSPERSGCLAVAWENMNAQPNPTASVRIRVVVADDHSVVRGMVCSALQQHPHFRSSEKLRMERKR